MPQSIRFPLLLVLYEVVAYLSNDMYVPALPILQQGFHLSVIEAQQLLSIWFLGGAALQLLIGPLSDRFGRRTVLLSGGVIFIGATLVCAMTHSFVWLLTARLFQGMTTSSMIVAGYACIHESFDNKQAVRTTAWMGSVTVLAPAFGPLLGAVVLSFAGWRAIFYLLAACGFIAVTGLFRYMPETLPVAKRSSLEIKPLLKSYAAVLRNRTFLVNALAFCCVFSALIVWIVEGPFLTITHLHKTALQFGVYQLMIFGVMILGNYLTRQLISVIPTQKLIRWALIITLIGCLLMLGLSYVVKHGLFGLFVGLICFSLGAGMLMPPLQRLTIAASTEPMGIRMAVLSCLTCLFSLLACVLVRFCTDDNVFSFALLLSGFGFCGILCKVAIPHKKMDFSADADSAY